MKTTAPQTTMAESQSVATGWWEPSHSGVVLRHSRAAVASKNGVDDKDISIELDVPTATSGGDSDSDGELQENIKLPQSTHSLLFTEKVLSFPFAFALLVVCVSITCLALALSDNLSGGYEGNRLDVPVNVSPQVRAAQYFSILIALTMEEEIPTAMTLLRMIPRSAVENKLQVPYLAFVLSAFVRLAIGYLFLINVFLVIAQSNRVLDIFYDMLALNFVSMIDDIAFLLAKSSIIGKRLRIATLAKCFRTEFERKPYIFRKKMTFFIKFLYIFNLLAFTGGLISISAMQKNGRFYCDSVTVTFGEDIWEHAWAETSPGQYEKRVLIYSNFNGVYKQDGSHDGRPIYKEMRKSDHTPFQKTIGAEIKFCNAEKAWIFSHPNIRKSNPNTMKSSKSKELEEGNECRWLLRSQESPDTYDLLDVSGEWSIWVGVINRGAQLSVTCNSCKSDTDCNLNGVCLPDKTCFCDNEDYYGLHCHLEKPCPRIIGESSTWSILYNRKCGLLMEHGRPVYTLHTYEIEDLALINNGVADVNEEDFVNIIYSGSRWMMTVIPEGNLLLDGDTAEARANEYHAFWDVSFSDRTIAISDPTSKTDPIGVDFYRIGERGDDFGPFGVLYPLQDPPGRGRFICDKNITAEEAAFSHVFTDCVENSTST